MSDHLVLRDLRHCLTLLALVRMVEKMKLDVEERSAVAGLLRRTADRLENLRVLDDSSDRLDNCPTAARVFVQ